MPLALVVDDISTVPEALRAEYVEKDGKHHLNVEGIEDTKGLKSALEKERTNAKTASQKVSAWEKLGKSPEEVQAMLEAQAAAEQEALKKAGKFDDVLKQHQDKWSKDSGEKIAMLTTERDEAVASERTAVVDSAVTTALTKSKVTAEGLDLLTERLGKRIAMEKQDGKRVMKVKSADGTDMIGTGPGGSATIDDLVKEAVKQYPSLFEGTGAGGGGTPSKQGASGANSIKRSDFDKLPYGEQAAKLKAGVQLVE